AARWPRALPTNSRVNWPGMFSTCWAMPISTTSTSGTRSRCSRSGGSLLADPLWVDRGRSGGGPRTPSLKSGIGSRRARRPVCYVLFPRRKLLGTPRLPAMGRRPYSAAITDPNRPRPAGGLPIPTGPRAANAFQPALSRLRTLERRELPLKDSDRVFERGDRDADEPDALLDRKQWIEQRPRQLVDLRRGLKRLRDGTASRYPLEVGVLHLQRHRARPQLLRFAETPNLRDKSADFRIHALT
ncbi:hypothetical protein KXV85_001428, partial [Aspergillus fumigatus]